MMKDEECKCVVCKQTFTPYTGFTTADGPVCSAVCASYLINRDNSGKLDESDDLNEVQLIL